jgi:uncharacterized protein YjbI with pentapeptide repeats
MLVHPGKPGGRVIVEESSVFSVSTFVNKLFTFPPGKESTADKLELLMQYLQETRDSRTRQIILDKMMSEDLLRGADLCRIALNDVHLEGANLEMANLSQGALSEVDLEGANLARARLSEADLSSADLVNANLRGAELTRCQLNGARLVNAQLNGANLQNASLQDASLYEADLSGARLNDADLRGCCLRNVNLHQASLDGALFDENTVLPDGEPWTPQTDMADFTQAE